MKLYLRYEEPSDASLHMVLKMKIPKKWRAGPVDQLKDFFVEQYNKKHSENQIVSEQMHFAKDKTKYAGDRIVEDVFQSHNDVYLREGVVLTAQQKADERAARAKANEGLLQCRNYGCQQMYDPNNNEEGSCQFHVKPPIFHDIKKGWSCCGKMVYDWDAFQAIQGCATGKHSNIPPAQAYAASPTVTAAAAAEARAAANLKSIDSYNVANPDAVTAASAAASMVKKAQTKPAPKDAQGRSKCMNKGCGQYFFTKDNAPQACRYHPKAPVFHDTKKYYACCPDNVVYDFDAFMQIEGCTLGPHSDVLCPPCPP
eukprot:g1226.t1